MEDEQKIPVIEGIHNYCDRWCERCDFIRRCNVGLQEISRIEKRQEAAESRALMEALDLPLNDEADDDEDWLEDMKTVMEETADMLEQLTEEAGVTMTEEEEAASLQAYRDKRKALEAFVNQSPLKKCCHDYGMSVHRLFSKTTIVADAIAEQMNLLLMTNSGDSIPANVEKAMQEMKEATEVIQWFGFFLEPKFSRALEGKFDLEQEAWFAENGFQSDADGSAKIGLIAVDRSIAAWQTMMRLLPAIEDEALTMLSLLQQIRAEADIRFPKAWLFKRPGFDD